MCVYKMQTTKWSTVAVICSETDCSSATSGANQHLISAHHNLLSCSDRSTNAALVFSFLSPQLAFGLINMQPASPPLDPAERRGLQLWLRLLSRLCPSLSICWNNLFLWASIFTFLPISPLLGWFKNRRTLCCHSVRLPLAPSRQPVGKCIFPFNLQVLSA